MDNLSAQAQLETAVFGERLLITDQHDWTTEEIILAYRGQSRADWYETCPFFV
jgi:hypothetical protein